ncbi:MAG TPA: outer membrane beta-barrel protein [Xanthobacteraceae bacterium]
MRKLLPGGVALMVLGAALGVSGALGPSPARAGDLEIPSVVPAPAYKAPAPVMRVYDWTGFYVGGNAGGHWGSDKITTTTDVDFEGLGAAGGLAIDAASGTTLHPSGFIGGLQAGYNIEGSGGVFGIEVDANWLGGTATRSLSNIPVINPRDVLTNTTQASFLSTMRLRWGTTVLSDRSLFFLTAGFAVETIKTTDSMGHFGNAFITSTSNSTTVPGYSVGFGFEYAFTDSLSAKAEYLYIGLKNVSTTIPATAGNADGIAVVHDVHDHIGRFGLNYKFGGYR